MKSKIRITGKLFNPRSHASQTGATLYSFQMQVSDQDKKSQEWVNVWLPVTIFDKENQHEWIMQSDKLEVTLQGQLTVKPGYIKRDGTVIVAHIGVFGFDINLGDKLIQQPQHKQ